MGLNPASAHALRRKLGAELKKKTPQPFRSMIYKRNLKRYGDPLGPKFDPMKHTDVQKILSDTNPIVNLVLKLPPKGLPTTGAIGGGYVGYNISYEKDPCGC